MSENKKVSKQEFVRLEIIRNNSNEKNDKLFDMTVPNKSEEVGKMLQIAEYKGMSKPKIKNLNWYD